jgi:hypothetical protein
MQFDFVNDTVVNLANSETVSVGAADVVSSELPGKGVLVVTTVNTWVSIGSNPNTATSKGLVPAGSTMLFSAEQGDKVAVKAVGSDTGSATLYWL